MSFTERLVHAVGYEVFAVLLCAPLLSWVMGKSLATAGALAVTLSVIAMLWNMVYNALVDRYVRVERIHWKASARFAHGLGLRSRAGGVVPAGGGVDAGNFVAAGVHGGIGLLRDHPALHRAVQLGLRQSPAPADTASPCMKTICLRCSSICALCGYPGLLRSPFATQGRSYRDGAGFRLALYLWERL
ncbi:transmembrane pair domain-containing protein [Pseudomonas putida S11]|nr:transmembrane pair domain-containing protein [Pseudomonas putida S11]